MTRTTSSKGNPDFFITPNWATRILLDCVQFDGPIWEPACGNGQMVKCMRKYKYKVIATDLIPRGFGRVGIDFLREDALRAPNIVTNPPYAIGEKFVKHALDLHPSGKVAFLARTLFLEGKKRYDMFQQYPPSRIIVLSWRVNFATGLYGGYFSLSWFVWDFTRRIKATQVEWAKFEGA
jgi:hypothetical protein